MLNNGLTDPYICTLIVNIFLKYFQAGLYYPKHIKTKDIYVRLHGPSQIYALIYDDNHLTNYAGKLKKWQSEGHEIWAYFNNDMRGYVNAKRILEQMN